MPLKLSFKISLLPKRRVLKLNYLLKLLKASIVSYILFYLTYIINHPLTK